MDTLSLGISPEESKGHPSQSVTGWDWPNVVTGAGSALAFPAAGRLRRHRAKLINTPKETDS